MKLKTLRTLAVLAAPLLLASCNKTDPYAQANEALSKQYSYFEMEVITSEDQLSLKSTYKYTLSGAEYSIEYSIQEFSEFSMEGSSAQKTTSTGTKKVDATKVNFKKFMINTSTYKDIYYNVVPGIATAEVVDPKSFLGLEEGEIVTDMVVSMKYDVNLETLGYTYISGNIQTEVNYTEFK